MANFKFSDFNTMELFPKFICVIKIWLYHTLFIALDWNLVFLTPIAENSLDVHSWRIVHYNRFITVPDLIRHNLSFIILIKHELLIDLVVFKIYHIILVNYMLPLVLLLIGAIGLFQGGLDLVELWVFFRRSGTFTLGGSLIVKGFASRWRVVRFLDGGEVVAGLTTYGRFASFMLWSVFH